ncbi:hypothetical protein ACHAWU_006176 [Discostella pseudostelligera]|uniref:Uncharacterized protein n=1 Tax=Discostella pseudostelligera TaxID=259834 RepID=A0ABD3M8P4_9STRA
MADADEHDATAVGGDGTAATAAAADTISSNNLPAPTTDKCNLSVASTPTHSSSKSPSIAVGRSGSGMSRVTFPASPALSTLSKNTSSSGTSSFASAAKMSVDDILSSSILSLGARQKAMRTIVQNTLSAVKVENGKQNATTTLSSGGVPPQQSIRPQHITSSSTPTANTLKIQRPRQNPGQEERKKRLERLQQDLLQRQLLEFAKTKHQAPQQNNSVDRETNSEDDSSKQSSVSSKKRSGSLLVDEVPSNTDTNNLEATTSPLEAPSKSTTYSPTSRRPKRAKAVTSYNATDLAKNNIIPDFRSSSSASTKSLPPSVVKPSKSTTTSDKLGGANDETINLHVESQSAQSTASLQTPLNTDIADEPDEIDEPESAQLALTALLAKYDSFIESRTKSNIEGGEKNNSSKGSSPWAIVQSLLSCLSHISLFDPDFLASEECRQVEIGLARIFKSSNRVRWEVMNRNSQSSDDEELLAAKEAHLIQLIQVQVWMRMMVWSFEREAGWEFLLRVIALADAEWDQQVEGNGTSKRGKKKKKGKKDEREQPKHESASEGLVHDLRQLMELAPYVLPASLNFSQWLRDTLTFGFRQPIPDYGAQLFDHFEIEVNEPIALKRSGTDNSRQSERSEVSHSPVKSQTDNATLVVGESPTKRLMEKRQKSQQAYFLSLAEEEKSASNGADDESATATGSFSTVTSVSRSSSTMRERVDPLLLKTSVSLTAAAPAQTSNPFLKGSARGVYVGSHLGSKLSNITSLFREVKAPAKPIVEKKMKATKQLDTADSSATSSGGVSASSGLNKRKDVVGSAKTQFSSSTPNETPFKRPRPVNNTSRVSRAPMFAIEETPVRPIIDETPAKKSNPTARTRLRLRDELPLMGNSIVAETPQQQPMRRGGPNGLPWRSQCALRQPLPSPYVGNSIIAETPQQQPMRRGGAAPSSVLPTNLWHRHDMQRSLPPPPPRQPFRQPNNPSQGNQRRQMQAGRNNNGQHQHLSPINHPSPGASAPLNFGLSPMPNQEDMAQVMAKVAKSAARKEGMK